MPFILPLKQSELDIKNFSIIVRNELPIVVKRFSSDFLSNTPFQKFVRNKGHKASNPKDNWVLNGAKLLLLDMLVCSFRKYLNSVLNIFRLNSHLRGTILSSFPKKFLKRRIFKFPSM